MSFTEEESSLRCQRPGWWFYLFIYLLGAGAELFGSWVEVARLGVPPYERVPWGGGGEGFTSWTANGGEGDAGAANKQAPAE